MIKYLIKFVSEIEHANMLMRGELFMRPASYYHRLEHGQGDIREAIVFDGICMYKNGNFPIYCLYMVNNDEIKDKCITISERCISDFKCKQGYAVLIDYSEFEKLLPSLQTDGYSMWAGAVRYKIPSAKLGGEIISSDSYDNLFLKHPVFVYQKEYRIVIGKAVYRNDIFPVVETDKVVYKFQKRLDDIAQIIEISKLRKENGNHIINLDCLRSKTQ